LMKHKSLKLILLKLYILNLINLMIKKLLNKNWIMERISFCLKRLEKIILNY